MKNVFKNVSLYGLFILLAVAALTPSCKKNNDNNPVSAGLSPDSAAGGNLLTLTGSGLSDMRSIVFDNHNVPASFNPNFNTGSALIFRVPDTAYGGKQNIIFTNSAGKTLTVPFNVIALATISSASLYEFTTGTQLTLTGNNLDNVSKVVLSGTTAAATIVSKSRKTLVITMPAVPSATLYRTKLDVTNTSGTITTAQEFVSVDNAMQFYTDAFGAGISDWSWAASSQSTDFALMGTKSLKEGFSSGAWAALSFHADNAPIPASNYTFLTFWVKGGTASVQINIASENGGSTTTITVPPTVWTYFRLPVAGWINGVNVVRLNFQMQGPNGDSQTLYFDNVLFVK